MTNVNSALIIALCASIHFAVSFFFWIPVCVLSGYSIEMDQGNDVMH